MKRPSLIAEQKISDIFSDKRVRNIVCLAKLEFSDSAFNVFANEIRSAALNYIRDVKSPTTNEMVKEIKMLEHAARSKQYEIAAELLANLSKISQDFLNERGQRPGWIMVIGIQGARLPEPDVLFDPERREMAAKLITKLCRQGGGFSNASLRLYAPTPQRNPMHRAAARSFITSLSLAYANATGKLPPLTANSAVDRRGPFANLVQECFRLVGAGGVNAAAQINELQKQRKAAARSERQKLAALLSTVYQFRQDSRWRVADLTGSDQIALQEVLKDIASEAGEVNSRRLGKWLTQHEDRSCDGFQLQRQTGRAGAAYWRVRIIPRAADIG